MSFAIENKIENGFSKIILKDNDSNTSVEIIPSCGAILHAFKILHDGIVLNVIDNYDSADDFTANISSKGFKSCKLSPFACRLRNATYTFSDKTFKVGRFFLGESSLHGFLYDAVFEIESADITDQHAAVSLLHQYKGTEKGYPFYYDCIITYELKANNQLTISTDIINKDENVIPIQDGWHPYFTFGGKIDNLLLEFQSKEKMLFDDAMIPKGQKMRYEEFESLKKIGQQKFDDCFTVNFDVPIAIGSQPICVLRDTSKKLQIEIHPEKSYPYLQIYTPDHRNSIAIENLSAPPDTFNNGIGLIVLQPNEKRNFITTYKISSLL